MQRFSESFPDCLGRACGGSFEVVVVARLGPACAGPGGPDDQEGDPESSYLTDRKGVAAFLHLFCEFFPHFKSLQGLPANRIWSM